MIVAHLEPTVTRRRRWVRLVFWGTGALVLVAGAFAAAVTSVRFDGSATVRFVAGSEVVTLPMFGAGGSHVLHYHHGETVTFSFPLENDGPVPVTIESVRLGDDVRPMLEVERASVGGDELPTRLGAGESVSVQVTARYGNCRYYHEREIQSYPSAEVEASTLGVGVSRTVAFDHPLVVHSPMIVECPDRTLARDDDVRGEG